MWRWRVDGWLGKCVCGWVRWRMNVRGGWVDGLGHSINMSGKKENKFGDEVMIKKQLETTITLSCDL